MTYCCDDRRDMFRGVLAKAAIWFCCNCAFQTPLLLSEMTVHVQAYDGKVTAQALRQALRQAIPDRKI